jgi:hypothetical protein
MFVRHASHLTGSSSRDVLAAEKARAGGQPDRRVAPRAPDLEHFDPRLRGSEGEQQAAGRRRDLPRALRRGHARLALGCILGLEAGQHVEHALVEHQSGTSTTTMPSSRTDTG